MPETVRAYGGNYLHEQIADVMISLLSFPSGVKAHIFVSWLYPFKEQKVIVVGDRKMVVFDDMDKKDKLLLYPHSIDWKNNSPVANKADAQPVELDQGEPLRTECLHFLGCAATRTWPRTDGDEGLRVLSVLHRCQKALEKKSRRQEQHVPSMEKKYFAHKSAFVDNGVELGFRSTHVLNAVFPAVTSCAPFAEYVVETMKVGEQSA